MTTTSSPLKCLPQWAASLALLLMASANLYAQQPMAITLKGDAEVPAVTLEKIGDAYSITAVHLDLVASIPGADAAAFERIANLAKAEITLTAKLQA